MSGDHDQKDRTVTTTEAGLIDVARRGLEACGLKVAEVIATMEEQDIGVRLARSALDDLSAASDALAHLADWASEPNDPFFAARFAAVARYLANFSDDEIVSAIRNTGRTTGE